MNNQGLIIVGAGWAGQTVASAILEKGEHGVVGFLDDKSLGSEVIISVNNEDVSIPILGVSSELMKVVTDKSASGVVIAVTHSREGHLLNEIVKCHEHGIPIHEMPEFYARLNKKIPVRHLNHHWIVPRLTEPTNDLYTFFHDATNYLISLVGLIFVCLPLFPIIALVIKLDSKGPVFFKQERVGLRGKTFLVMKFRTMRSDAEKDGAVWAKQQDDRITKVGSFLRKYRLDELPQFINVLKRDMGLIGPRPERPEFVQSLAEKIPFYNYRHLVRPGISGWAQVNYPYGNTVEDAVEKLQYDLYWIKNRSFWLDLKIVFKSIKVMLTGYGAV